MIYQPSENGSIVSWSSASKTNHLQYNPPEWFYTEIERIACEIKSNPDKVYKVTISLDPDGYESTLPEKQKHLRHLERVMMNELKLSIRTVPAQLIYVDMVDWIVGFIAKLESAQQVEIDLSHVLDQNFPLDELIAELQLSLFRKGKFSLYGFGYEFEQIPSIGILCRRLSVNGFMPENCYPVQDGETIMMSNDYSLEQAGEIMFQITSSLKVGQLVYFEFPEDFHNKYEISRVEYISHLRLFDENFRFSTGFKYQYKRIDQRKVSMQRLTWDDKAEPVIEP